MLEKYRKHLAERDQLGIPPLPLNAKQTSQLYKMLKSLPVELKVLEGAMVTVCKVF